MLNIIFGVVFGGGVLTLVAYAVTQARWQLQIRRETRARLAKLRDGTL